MEEAKPKLKEAMKIWNAAVAAHTSGRYSDAVGLYDEVVNKSARMYYNMSCAYEKLSDVDNALKSLTNAVEKDSLLALAYFQRGSLFLLQKRTKEAATDLEKARELMRENSHINYKPLGLLCRMHSYQVLHNSALACILDNKTTEAKTLLTEALHDADDAQKQIINKIVECLQTGDVDHIKPLLIPTDRVFTPPKSITKNLVKKSLMQKARVVSAADMEDLSPKFNGSKRVEQIRQLQAKNDARNPIATRRFFKKPRDRRASDVTGIIPPMPLRSSRSMGDIQNFEQFFEGRTNEKSGDKNSLTLRITSSESENNVNQNSQSLTAVTEPKMPKSPRSPLLRGVKKLLKSKPASRTSAPVMEYFEPVMVMRGCGSTGDLEQLEEPDEDPIMMTFADLKSSLNNTKHKNDSDTATRSSQSLGKTFGNSLTVTGQTLSLSCDVLTAFATLSENGCDFSDDEYSEPFSDSDSSNSSEKNNERERPQFFIERDYDRNTSIIKRINFKTPENDEKCQDNSTTIMTTATSRDDVTSRVIAQDNFGNRDTMVDDTKSGKPRPPPPAYAPPPLPRISVKEA